MKKILIIIFVVLVVFVGTLSLQKSGKIAFLASSAISQKEVKPSDLVAKKTNHPFKGVILTWWQSPAENSEICNVMGRLFGTTEWKNYTTKKGGQNIPNNIAPIIPPSTTNTPQTTEPPTTTEEDTSKKQMQVILGGFYTGTYEFKISCTGGESNDVSVSFDKDTYCRDYREKQLEVPCACISDNGNQISPSNTIQSSFFLQSSAVSQEDDLKKDIEKLQTGTQDILKLFQKYATCDDKDALKKNYQQFKGLDQAEEDARKNNSPFALSAILAIKAADEEIEDISKKGDLLIESVNQLNIALLKYKENDIMKRYKAGISDKIKELDLDGFFITRYCDPIYVPNPFADNTNKKKEFDKLVQARQAWLSRLKKLKAQIKLLGTDKWQNV